MKLIVMALALILLTGCATSPINVGEYTQSDNINYPIIGMKTTKGIGERLVAKGTKTTGPAIEIIEATQFNKKEGSSSIMTCAVTVMPISVFKRGVYTKDSIKADCYGPVTYHLTLSDGSTNWNCPGKTGIADVCVDSKGNYFLAALSSKVDLLQDFDHIRMKNMLVEHRDNFVQELVYNGRVGNNLKFIYREFSDDMARPAFTQEVQYDYSESPEIGFKALRMKIIDATNINITYVLTRNF